MHLLLTDRLSCPRCGPEFGLILLAREVRNRRIIHGDFGCANCRETYPVEEGFGDLRAPPRDPLPEGAPDGPTGEETLRGSAGDRAHLGSTGDQAHQGPVGGTDDEGDEVLRLAALMGVSQGPGTLLVAGPAVSHAHRLVGMVEGVEIVAVDASLRGAPEVEGVSRIVAGPGLPFFSGSFQAVALSGEAIRVGVGEATRVLAPRGRLVYLSAPTGILEELREAGVKIILEQDGIVVGEQERPGPGRLVTLRGP